MMENTLFYSYNSAMIYSSSVIGEKQKLTEIRETPEEAIMV